MENLKFEMDEIIKELKKETSYGILKYDWPKEHAKRLYNHSVGNILFCSPSVSETAIKSNYKI